MNSYEVKDETIEGTFIRECKGRFVCEVMIDNKVEKCYVPSSAKLNKFIMLKNKKILVTSNSTSSKTRYTLWSVTFRKKQVLLNLNKVNQIIEEIIKNNSIFKTNYDSIQREKVIENYKCDLLLLNGKETEIIEIKTVISTERKTVFPSVKTKRAIEQLEKIKFILGKGYKVKYIIVSLSPFVKNIELNDAYEEYKLKFLECVELGMEVVKLRLICKDKLIFCERI